LDPLVPTVLIRRDHWDQMRADVIARAPEEACGLVAGIGHRSYQVFKISNILHSPTLFRLDPQQQLEALLMIEENNLELLAIYHSHPGGPFHPSDTDISEAAYPDAVNLIWYPHLGNWYCRGYLIEEGSYKEISMAIYDTGKSL
jgi:proteasome lid subunit RPN8/RPN11